MILRRLLKDTVIYGSGNFIGRILLFIAFPFVANVLAPKAFGVLELIVTSTTLLGMIVNCGLNNAAARFYWEADTSAAERPSIISTGFFLLLAFSVAALLISLVIIPFVMPYIAKTHVHATWVALFAAVVLMGTNQTQQYLLNILRLHFAPFKYFLLCVLSNALIAIAGVVAVVFWKLGLDGYVAAQALVGLIMIPLAIWAARQDIRFRIERKWVKTLLQFGAPFIFANVAYWVFGSTDRWVLTGMSSVYMTGVYSVAFKFSSIVYFVSFAFGLAWNPMVIKLKTDFPDTYRHIYVQVFCFLLLAMVIVGGGVALFSGEVISTLMSPAYAGSAIPLTILCIGIIMQSTQNFTALGISLEKKTHLIARMSWIAAIVNLLLNFALIPYFGAAGAAWATTLSYLVLTSGYLFYAQRLHPLPIAWGKIALLALLAFVILVVAFWAHSNRIDWALDAMKLGVLILCGLLGAWVCLHKAARPT